MERKNNYLIQRERAKEYFLKFDQETIIEKYKLKWDAIYMYVDFFGASYRIRREDGQVERGEDGFSRAEEAGFSEVLSIFDFLCHGDRPFLPSGVWAPVNSLKNRPRTIGVGTGTYEEYAKAFDEREGEFHRACEHMGASAIALGDIGYEFPVFGEMRVRMKFYRADEEFPAQAVFLWDQDTLLYVYYETVFYMMGFLCERILEIMGEAGKGGEQ